MPRSGSNFSLGDFLDVDLAQIEWMPTRSQRTSIFFGKTDSVIGIEYRERKANQRFGITPTLIARYTTGTGAGPQGAQQVRARRPVRRRRRRHQRLEHHRAVPLLQRDRHQRRQDRSGRLSLHPPLPIDLELGVSGSYGSQDLARDSRGIMWFAGVDFTAHVKSVDFKAQVLKGAAPGRPQDDVYGLELHKAGYAELDWMLTPVFGLLGRGELRDAFVWLGDATTDAADNRALPHASRGAASAAFAWRSPIAWCSRPSTCTTASTAASRKSRTTSSRRRCCSSIERERRDDDASQMAGARIGAGIGRCRQLRRDAAPGGAAPEANAASDAPAAHRRRVRAPRGAGQRAARS